MSTCLSKHILISMLLFSSMVVIYFTCISSPRLAMNHIIGSIHRYDSVYIAHNDLCNRTSHMIVPVFSSRNETQDSCLQLGYSNDPLPRTALASYPGSGNTWVRHLIQQLTGRSRDTVTMVTSG